MVLNTSYSVTTKHGKIEVEVNNGMDTPGVTVVALGKQVLDVSFDNVSGYLVVNPIISNDGTVYSYKVNEENIENETPTINGLTLHGELGEIQVLPISDESFQGVSIHALGLLVGQVEFNEIDKSLNVYVWDEDSHEFKEKYTYEMPIMA